LLRVLLVRVRPVPAAAGCAVELSGSDGSTYECQNGQLVGVRV